MIILVTPDGEQCKLLVTGIQEPTCSCNHTTLYTASHSVAPLFKVNLDTTRATYIVCTLNDVYSGKTDIAVAISKRSASINYIRLIDGERRTLMLCEECRQVTT